MSNAILVEESGSSLIVRFNRPEMRNPLAIEVLELLSEMVANIEDCSLTERLVFTGVGDVFASGADLREIAAVGEESAREFARRGQKLMDSIARLRAETFAAVNGFCFGGALDLALACDHRIASSNALFAHPGAELGIMTGWGGTQRLPRLVGEARALEMFLTTRRVSASEALQIGLIDEMNDEPVEAAMRFRI